MPSAEPFPLYFPGDAQRAFGDDELRRRIARTLHFDEGTKILDLCFDAAGSLLAGEFGCQITAVASDDAAVAALRKAVKPGTPVNIQKVEYARLPFPDGSFDAVLAVGRVPLPLIAALTSSRRLLVPNGRVVLTYPVKVGRFPAKLVTDSWAERLGEPLLLPREALQRAERAGFEPESIETLNDAELLTYYQDFERALSAKPAGSEQQLSSARQELETHKSSGAKASVTFGLLFARRKEPGEKPSTSRDSG